MKKLIQRIVGLINLSFLLISNNAIADNQKTNSVNPVSSKNHDPTISLKLSLDSKGLIETIQSARGIDCVGTFTQAKPIKK